MIEEPVIIFKECGNWKGGDSGEGLLCSSEDDTKVSFERGTAPKISGV